MPFDGSNVEEVKQRIINKNLSFNGERWSAVSDSCIDLLKNMFNKDPDRRYDIADVILHPCLANYI